MNEAIYQSDMPLIGNNDKSKNCDEYEYDEYDEGDCTQDSSQVPLEGIFVDEENGLVVS